MSEGGKFTKKKATKRKRSDAIAATATIDANDANDANSKVFAELPADESHTERNLFYDALLSGKPFWQQGRGESSDACNAACNAASSAIYTPTPLTPEYCRFFRREPHSGRRACARADARQCVGQLYMRFSWHDALKNSSATTAAISSTADATSSSASFAYMEFLTPEQDDVFRRSGELPRERQLCEMCVRFQVAYFVLATRRRQHAAAETLNPFTHVCDVPGGYRKSACLLATPTHADGLVGTFRRFDTTEYVSVVEPLDPVASTSSTSTSTSSSTGHATQRYVRGHDEVADVFFA